MVQGAVYDAVNAIDGGHRAVPRRAGGDRLRVEDGRCRAGGARRPRRALPGPDRDSRRAADDIAERRSRWHREGRRPGDRPGDCRGDDHGADERRPVRPVDRRAGHHARRVAPGAARSSRATRRAGSATSSRSSCRRGDLFRSAGPNALTSARLRRGLQRGQVARLGDEHDPDRRPDRRGDLVAGPRRGALQPDHAQRRSRPGARHHRRRTDVRR